jgi:hypothetical protein
MVLNSSDSTFGIKSGDVVLFSGSLLTATALKWGTGSRWNHAGIGVWIENGIPTIDRGKLYIFEINTTPRYDIISGEYQAGIGFTDLDTTLEIYNTIGVRTMEDLYRPQFTSNIIEFYNQNRDLQFNSNTMKFIRGWLGIEGDTDIHEDGVFCTEMMAYAYSYCLKRPIDWILKIPDITPQLCIPSSYTYRKSSRSIVFPYPEYIIKYKNEYFINSVIVLVVVTIILILIAIVITMAANQAAKMYRNRYKHIESEDYGTEESSSIEAQEESSYQGRSNRQRNRQAC